MSWVATLILLPLGHLLPLVLQSISIVMIYQLLKWVGLSKGRKVMKRKPKAVDVDPMVDVMTKELSILGSTKLKDSEMFARYVSAQESKVQASIQAIALRD